MEAKSEIPIKIEFGKEYYIRCSVTMGALVGRPKLEIIDDTIGRREYNAMQQKKKTKK